MPTTITDDQTKFPALVAPSAGDAGVAASIQSLAQEIGNRTAHLHAGALLNWEKSIATGTGGIFPSSADMRGGDYDVISKRWLLAGNTDACNMSKDDARTYNVLTAGMSSTVALQDCAIGATSSAIAVGNSATVYRRATILSGSWVTITAPAAPTTLRTSVYDTSNSKFIIVGEKAASAPYAATSTDDVGTAFTDRSSAIPAGFAGLGLESLAVDEAGNAVVFAEAAHTKAAFSTDGGVTWSDSTTTLTSGRYNVAWNISLALFVAVRVDSVSAANVYTSPDGDTWTLRFSSSLGFDAVVPTSTEGHAVASYGVAIVVAGELNTDAVISVSFDSGVTWSIHLVSDVNATSPLVQSRSNSMVLAIQTQGYRSTRRAGG